MVPKGQSHLDAPPAAFSSEEVESSEEDSGSGSDSDSELENTTKLSPEPSSSSYGETETEADSESESEVDPIAKARVKRPAAEEEEEKSNPKKKKSESGEGSSRSGMVWGGYEEVATLKGMALYRAEKGVDPQADMNGFYDFMKKWIKSDFTKSQFLAKVRGLKRKYTATMDENQSYSALEMNLFDLAKNAWGLKEEPESNSNTKEEEEEGDVEAVIKRMMEKAQELHRKWREMEKVEMNLWAMKMNLRKKQLDVILQGQDRESSMR